jgi:hypothetical protein
MDFLLCSAVDYVNRAIDRARATIVPSTIQLLTQLLPTDPAFSPAPPIFQSDVYDFLAYDQAEVVKTPERLLLQEPFMEDLGAFITPAAPTIPVPPMAPLPVIDTLVERPIVLTHTLTISGGNSHTRRNLALEFARCAAPTAAAGRKRCRYEETETRSGRSKKLPKHLEEYLVRSDLFDSEDEE